MKNIWNILKDTFALKMIYSIFDNDAHSIVSKKGWGETITVGEKNNNNPDTNNNTGETNNTETNNTVRGMDEWGAISGY